MSNTRIKYNLSQVIWKYWYSKLSSGEHGTLYQLRNKISRTNVVTKPFKNYNACDDFFQVIMNSHIIAATLTMLEMKSADDTPSDSNVPNALNVWMESTDTRKEILRKICKKMLDTHVSFSFNSVDTKTTKDNVREYGRQLLGLGLFYLEYSDAIRQGDGRRLLRCWRYLLPVFKASGRRNYSCEVVNMLYQHLYQLSPRLSSQLLWSRFINVHGRPGKNIPADLHMEHLNRLVKEAMKNLGANKTEKACERIGKALGTIRPVLHQFDDQISLLCPSGVHHISSMEKDTKIIVKELMRNTVFKTVQSRKHKTFPHPKNLLHTKSKDELLSWIITRLESHHLPVII